MSLKNKNNIVWIDMEMTGLDCSKDKILEVACLVTDSNLNIISEDLNMIVHQPDELLNNMSDWCTTQHTKTGLLQASRESVISEKDVEKQLLEFLKNYTVKHTAPLAGNSVYMDRIFLQNYMKEVNDYLHYRIIDVSSIKELARRWKPKIISEIQKHTEHRALSDIKKSINELKHYKDTFFKI